jgi:hypothetical protein
VWLKWMSAMTGSATRRRSSSAPRTSLSRGTATAHESGPGVGDRADLRHGWPRGWRSRLRHRLTTTVAPAADLDAAHVHVSLRSHIGPFQVEGSARPPWGDDLGRRASGWAHQSSRGGA